MKKLSLILLILILLVGCTNRKAEIINEEGLKLYEEKSYDKAIDIYTEGIKEYSEFATFYTNRGMVYFDKGDIDKALDDLNTAISIEAVSPESYTNRGRIYLGIGDYQSALKDFYKAIEQKDDFELDDGLYLTYLNLGTLLNQTDNYNEALSVYQLALKERDDDPALYNAMGLLYRSQKLYTEALDKFDQALTLDQNYAYAYGNRGYVYYMQGKYDIALSDVNTALSLDPYMPQMYNIKGQIFIKKDDNENARKSLQQGIELWSSMSDYYITLGNIEYAEKNYGKSLLQYGLSIQYDNIEGHKGQGKVYRLIGQYEDAITSMEKYLEVYPEDLFAKLEIGLDKIELSKYKEAIEIFEDIDTDSDLGIEALYNKALCYEYLELYDKSIELLEEVLKKVPEHEDSIKELKFIKEHFILK